MDLCQHRYVLYGLLINLAYKGTFLFCILPPMTKHDSATVLQASN